MVIVELFRLELNWVKVCILLYWVSLSLSEFDIFFIVLICVFELILEILKLMLIVGFWSEWNKFLWVKIWLLVIEIILVGI